MTYYKVVLVVFRSLCIAWFFGQVTVLVMSWFAVMPLLRTPDLSSMGFNSQFMGPQSLFVGQELSLVIALICFFLSPILAKIATWGVE